MVKTNIFESNQSEALEKVRNKRKPRNKPDKGNKRDKKDAIVTLLLSKIMLLKLQL